MAFEMDFQYKKALEEHNLKIADLPEDAQTGIDGIKEILKGIKLTESRGRKASARIIKKLKANDKWVYFEILDHVHDTEKNKDVIPNDSDEVVEELEKEAAEKAKKEGMKENEGGEGNEPQPDALGLAIEKEFENMIEDGKTEISFDDLKSVAPKAYNVIFDAHVEGETNGIETSKFSLLETSENLYTLKTK
jgi:hypothetical protein